MTPTLKHPVLGCTCSEGWAVVRGKSVPLPPTHDCAYIKWRNQFVGLADNVAKEAVGPMRARPSQEASPRERAIWERDREVWARRWSSAYESEMRRLMTDTPYRP